MILDKKPLILLFISICLVTIIAALQNPPFFDKNYMLVNPAPIILSDKININTASVDVLLLLKGIGESKAQAIIDYREANGPFLKCEDIIRVHGISDKTYNNIKDDIEV